MLPKIFKTPTASVVTKQSLSVSIMADCFQEIEKLDLAVVSIHINPKDLDTLLNNLGTEHFDQKTTEKDIKGSVWGARVHVNNDIPINTIYFCGEYLERCVKLTFSEDMNEVTNG